MTSPILYSYKGTYWTVTGLDVNINILADSDSALCVSSANFIRNMWDDALTW
jgi:hypothetical protein